MAFRVSYAYDEQYVAINAAVIIILVCVFYTPQSPGNNRLVFALPSDLHDMIKSRKVALYQFCERDTKFNTSFMLFQGNNKLNVIVF